MYLFRRAVTVKPDHYLQAVEFSVGIAAKIKEITGRDVSVFEARFGAPLGTLSWTLPVASFADLDTFRSTLLGDAGYLAMLASGTDHFSSLPQDDMTNIIAMNFTESVQRFYLSTVATPTTGRIIEATTFGVTVQAYLAEHGFRAAFGNSVFGSFGQVGWLTGADSLAEIDRFQEFVQTDPKFTPMVDGAGGLFVPSSGQVVLAERIN